MSALSRWLGRIADRSIDRFARTSTLSQAIRERSRRDILALPRYDDPKRLARFEHQIFSQGGEDGIVREVFRRVGERSRTFVELGVGDGLENNTTFLLAQGWRGAWFDASAKECAKIRARFSHEIEARQLVLVESMLTAANVSATVAPHCNPNDLDLLSIDLDRNTYHVWAALDALKPRVAIVEYNALFPADVEWIVEDDAAKSWNGTSHFGASLEDHGPNVVLYRAGPQTARRAASLRGRNHSRQSSSTPKPLRRPSVPDKDQQPLLFCGNR